MRKFGFISVMAIAIGLGGCSLLPRKPAPQPSAVTLERLPLDLAVSPVPFRWLSPEAILVSPKTGKRALAGFGNYVCRVADRSPKAHLEVWDDEGAWKRSASGQDDQELSRKRAEYLKEPGNESVNRFAVFNRKGEVIYQRDFQAWPLTSMD